MSLVLLILFLLIFPKGGIKIGEMPVTWGYLLLGIFSLFCLFAKTYRFSRTQLYALMGLLPFQCISLFTLLNNGIENRPTAFAFFITFFILPYCFFFFLPEIQKRDLQWIKNGIFFISIYGIFLFFFKIITGTFLEIPFLTINYHDLHLLEETKNITRLGIYKLISTYNNGNLFGACILMLLPLYYELELRKRKRAIVKIALLLTLSRTVWIGLAFFELLYRFSLRTLFLLACGITIIGFAFHFSSSFFFDITFGGRNEQLSALFHPSIFSHKPFTFLWEIVYLGILERFGILGLFTFLIGMLTPIIFYSLNKTSHLYARSIISGLLIYLGICFSDGSMLLIPTMCIYWFLASFLLSFKSFSWNKSADHA